MSSQQVEHRDHPVHEFAGRLRARLEQLATTPVWSMTPAEQRASLVDLAKAEAQLTALRLRVLAEADRSGATDTATDTRAANTAQARAIVRAVELLPTRGEFAVGPEQRQQAQAHLVDLATDHDAKALAILGRKVFEVIAPDLAEAYEGAVLQAQEAAAARRTLFQMREDDTGTCHGRFRIPTLHGHILNKMILALCSPARPTHTDTDDDLPTPVRHGLAFCQLLEAIPAKSLPQAGGTNATIVVTMTLDQLTAALDAAGVCTLDTGAQISAAEARRLACTAGIIPAVLGTKSQVLDLGRTSRYYKHHQRIAMALRDQGCTTQGCDRPPALCHAHHDIPWSQGGPTDLHHGHLLCGHHHRRIHDHRHHTKRHPNGTITFHRRE